MLEFRDEIYHFLEINIELIDLADYHQLYATFRNQFPARAWGELTVVLLSASIDPLPECRAITPRCYAFNTDLNIPNVPGNIRVISERFLELNTGTTHIELPEGLGQINDNAFHKCKNLKSLNIPASLEMLGNSVFEQSGIEDIDLSNTQIKSLSYRTFAYTQNMKKCILPQALTEIGEESFFGSLVEEIHIPNSVNKIGNRAFANTGSLIRIIYDGTKAEFKNIKKYNTWKVNSDLSFIVCKDEIIKYK